MLGIEPPKPRTFWRGLGLVSLGVAGALLSQERAVAPQAKDSPMSESDE